MGAAAAPSAVINLPEILDLKAATALQADLLRCRGEDLVLDASDVRRLGGQCLQILLAARQTWLTHGHTFRVSNASEAFQQNLKIFGADLPGEDQRP